MIWNTLIWNRILPKLSNWKPDIDTCYLSIGHSAESLRSLGCLQCICRKTKPTITGAWVNKKDRDALKGVGLGIVTLIPFKSDWQYTRSSCKQRLLQTFGNVKRCYLEKSLRAQIWDGGIATVLIYGWEKITAIKKTGSNRSSMIWRRDNIPTTSSETALWPTIRPAKLWDIQRDW